MKTIKDAYEELNGDLKNTRNQRSHEGEFLFINTDNGRYLTFNGGCHKDNFQYICTVEEFNNYKPEKTVHDAVIHFGGNYSPAGYLCYSNKLCRWVSNYSVHVNNGYYEVCNSNEFNAYVDLLASNMGKSAQSYAEYKKAYAAFSCGVKVEHVGPSDYDVAPPEFTQEFRLISGRSETWHKCKVVFKGKRYTVVENENGKEFSRRTAKLVIRDVKPPVTLIDGEAYKFDFDNGSNIIQHKKMAMYDERRRCMWIKGHTYPIESCANIKPLTVEGK